MSGSTRLISLSQSSQRSYAILPRVPVDVMQELEGDSDGDGDSEGERPSRFEHRSVALSLEPLDTLRNPWSFRRLMRGGASAASSADGDNERLNSSSRRLSLSAGAVDDALPLPSCSDDDPSARRRCQDFLGASMSALRSCVDPTPHCPFLSIDSIESLLSRVRNILDPARPLPTFKIKMIRARTQEEFFRGHLRSNPIPFQDLVRVVKAWEATSFDSSVDRGAESPSAGALAEQQAASVSRTSLPDLGPGCSVDPTVADLKRYIAVTLEMPDSAELLELLCCGKILDGALPVRLVWEHVWKPYVSDSKPDGVYIPPMSVTYRLAGVDGEATEEQLSTIADASASPDKPLSERYAITSIFGRPAPLPVSTMPAAEPDAPGLHWLLHAFLAASDLAAAGGIVGELPCKVAEHSLAVLRMACCVPENAALLHKLGAPGRLLEQLLSLLRHSAPSTGSLARTRLLTSEGAERHRLVDPLTHMIAELMSTSESSESSGDLGPMGAGDASLLMAEAAASQKEEEDAAAGKRDHSDAYKQINFLVTSLRETVIEEELKSKPRLRVAVSRLLPALTCGEGDAVELLAAAAADAIRWDARSSRGAHGERQAEAMELESKTEDVVHESKDEEDSESSAASEAYALPASSQCIFDALSGYLTSSALCGKIRRAVALTDLLPRTVRAVLMDAPSLPVPTAAAFAIYKRDRHQGRAPKPVHMPSKEDCTRAWSTFAGKRTLLPCLKLLQGLCSAHSVAVDTILELPEGEGGRLLSLLHALEQANCVDAAGLAAENLLRAMRAVSVLAAASIEQIQTRTNEEKQRLASKRKKRALEAISRSPPEERAASSSQKARRKPAKKGRKPARAPKPSPKPSSWLQQAENLAEESGLACMICHEGYGLQPSSLLGVYGYMQPFTADRGAVEGAKLLLGGPEKAFEAGSVTKLKFCGTWTSIRPMSDTSVPMASTVTAFRPIHQQCHAAASDAAANSKTSRSEWESATMRNSRMRTNVVIPLYSPTVRAMDFRRALERYRSMAEGQCGMDSTGVLATVLHDARILSLRMAHRLDICKDAGGGSDVTNIALLPALLGIGSFVFWNVLTFCRKNDAPRGIGRGPRETIDFRSPMLADITDAARYAAIAHRFFSAAASKLPEPSPEVQEGVGGLLTTLRSVGSFQEVGESSAGEGSLPLLAGAAPFVCVLALVLVGKKDWHAARTLLLRELLRHAKLHPVEEERVSLIPATKASAREMRVALPGLSRSGRKRARSSAEPEPAPKDDGQQLPAWLSDILPGCSLQRSLPMLRFCALLFAVHDAMHAEATEENPEALYQLPSVASTVDEAATARVKSRIEAVESAASVGDAVDLLLAAD
uniref:E3 ubiquitin ligase UBR4 C-terminal domain-containing protein n=1 Tax=Pinguiococcus pyrenoidosus TaxID=172671 RepID=A0A7R9U1K9_9STRA